MTEREYILDRFCRCFEIFKDKKIFLYGQGVYTEAIIESFHKDYQFAAVLSNTDTSGEFYGVPLIHVDNLSTERPDMVILSEHKQTKEPDYEKIHAICEEFNILLYDMYGIDELTVHRELSSHCWQSFAGWQRITEGYDVVSFAALDTFMWWDGRPDGELKVRYIFKRLVKTLLDRQVSILFVGRNVLPRSVIANALVAGGIIERVEEAEECLYMRHGEDLCFRTIRDRFPDKKILHIGAGIVNDGIIPRFYDIDTYRMEFSGSVIPDKAIKSKGKNVVSGEKIYCDLKAAIDRNHVISFDVFDTLLLRKTLYPEDVFELTRRKALAEGIQVNDFVQYRKRAEQETYCGKLEDIYETMYHSTDLSKETCERLMALEMETEREVTTGRSSVVELYQYALAQGKRVILTSDMYMSEVMLGELLKANGIEGWDKLLVSCEYGCFKSEGLFDRLKAICAEKKGIVHIGDDFYADIQSAEEAGFETVYIPSARELARQSGWSGAIDKAENLAERCLVGLSVAGIFQDPFLEQNMRDMPIAQKLIRYGYTAAPVIMGYLTWMAEKLANSEYDGVLFAARDGWLLNEFYPKLKEAAKASVLPAARYFYTSRHAAFLPVSADGKNQNYVCGIVPELDHRQFLQNVFDIEETDLLPPVDGEKRMAYLLRHRSFIQEIAQKQESFQLCYFERCGLKNNGRYVLVDFMSQGSTQGYIKQFAPFDIHGLYFGRPAYAVEARKDIEYYLYSDDTALMHNYMEMESIMTSPEPSVVRFSADGRPVFAEEVRTKERLHQVNTVQNVIRGYVKEYLDLFYFSGEVIRPIIPEEIYAADGYHWVFEWMYDDWTRIPITT